MRRWAILPPLLMLAAACTRNIDEGQQIKEIVAPKDDAAAAPLPVVKSEQVAPSTELALQNYEKLLELPQDPITRAETMRRLADLNLEIDEASGGTDLKASEARLRRSVELYNTVLADQPTLPTNDRVLYQLARAYQDLGENDKAEVALQRLTRDYPTSSYADDAHFRRAEVLFKIGQFDDAAEEYRYIVALKGATPFFEAAQYKLGWAEYRQSNYESAIGIFVQVLSRELPPGELTDAKAALEGVKAGKKDMAQDALRVIALSFAQLGGGEAVNKYFQAHGEPPYSALVYFAVGEHLLEKKRYTDAAATYRSFVNLHPRHELAPLFLSRAIAAQDLGGFIEPVVEEKERYVRHFDPAGAYWGGRAPTPEVMKDLRSHLEDLARFYQSRAQKEKADNPAQARADFATATQRYRRLLDLYPGDAHAAELHFLLAEALFDAGDAAGAAAEYDRVVRDYPSYDKAPDAAYAALLACQKRSDEAAEAQKPEALRQSVAAALRLADRYPQHAQALPALTRASEDLYRLHDFDTAVQVAERVIKANPPAPEPLRRTAWNVTADAHFSQKRYAQAEIAYTALLELTPDAEARKPLEERLASSIYKQGEAARDAGDVRAAAANFLRVARNAPDASIRATADYDGAAMLIAAQDWTQAAAVLTAFRARNPQSPLLPELDKKLAVVFQNTGRLREAAEVLDRIAARPSETPQTRADAAWLAVTLLEQAQDARAAAACEAYLHRYPQPFDRAIEARQKLADFARARGDVARREHWLRELIAADAAAGSARTPRSRQLAAQAVLEQGRQEAGKARRIALKAPLKTSLPPKKKAIEAALATLTRAADYGDADVTTAATYEMGVLYQDFSKDLLGSPRPLKMGPLERQQYDLLLEEQAFPFEEKAIQFHEANLQRVAQGVYSVWVGRSLQALAQLDPAKYGKRELTEPVFPDVVPAVATQRPNAAAAGAGADQQRYAQGQEALKKGQWQDAEAALVAAVKAHRQHAGTHVNLGIFYARTGRKAEALSALTQAINLDPKNAVAYNWIGALAREGGDYRRAEASYRQAIAAAPSYAPAQLNLAILYDQYLKRPADALAAYRQYEQLAGRKDLRAAVWIAELQAQLPPAPAAPALPRPAPAAPRNTGVKS